MKDPIPRPPDAVACGCAMRKRARKYRRLDRLETEIALRRKEPSTFGRFFAHFVRKVFDSETQKSTKVDSASAQVFITDFEATPVTKITRQLQDLRLASPPDQPYATSTPKNESSSVPFEYMDPLRRGLELDTSSSSGDSSDSGKNILAKVARGVEPSARLELDFEGKTSRNGSMVDSSGVLSPLRLPRTPFQRPINYPKFHFPQGRPVSALENDAALRRASEVFRRLPSQMATLEDMPDIVTAFGLPLYWKRPIWDTVSRDRTHVTQGDFSAWWRALTTVAHDEAARFIQILSGSSRTYIVGDDFHNLVLDLIHSHPGLNFYRKSEEFHEKYIQVVIVRIMWTVNRSWSGRITATELRKSNLLQAIRQLETTEDINLMTDYFSYEHFYVIYCKFWEIDSDHDLIVNKKDFACHGDGALTPLVIDRLFSGAVTRGARGRPSDTRDLSDFAAFLLADEDKTHPTSIEYWFRILDLDGDGVISLYEMEIFYTQLVRKMDEVGIETMKFNDVVCNLIDMISPSSEAGFTLSDLKKSPLAGRFFNSFVNWKKFYTQETTEGEKASVKGNGEEELSDWNRFCLEEYEIMMDTDDDVDENFSVNLDDEDIKGSGFHDLL